MKGKSELGTNFYWIKPQEWMKEIEKNGGAKVDFDDPEFDYNIFRHIGKRSASGTYCESCGTTLCIYGTRHVHSGVINMPWGQIDVKFHDKCPVCRSKENVIHTCSFTWTFMRHKWELEKLIESGFGDEKVVRDEYGREYTAREFLNEEISSRIEFQDCAEFG